MIFYTKYWYLNWQTKKHQKVSQNDKIPVTNQLTLEGVLTLVKLVSELAVAGSPSSSNPNEANSYIYELLVHISLWEIVLKSNLKLS